MDSAMDRPSFLVGVDVEPDNLWGASGRASTQNGACVSRFQALCEKHGIRPTYLVDFDMARDERFVELGRDVLKRRAGEMGMHLHAWSTPPHHDLGGDGPSYLYEYPVSVMREKISTVTRAIAEAFGIRPGSHRAGRWGLNAQYAQLLAREGYTSDSSVTPWMSWTNSPGVSAGACGPDFRHYPSESYYLDLNRIDRPGNSNLLEIPSTVQLRAWSLRNTVKLAARRLGLRRGRLARAAYAYEWFRTAEMSADRLLRVLDRACRGGARHLMLSLHSSELMAGGSPSFPTQASIESMYGMLEALFESAARRCRARTMSEFARDFAARPRPVSAAP